ncbi:hypothetical protein [Aestuariimicrobium sp. Y1814]|uniref:hypothetical protein n=1 Tax=Aestuariimicrobium sp. Y1814 TaxID=3418742 RepID=UPI003DA6DA17
MPNDPFGRAHRSPRLSDQETAERMLATAGRRVQDDGLPISFDLLRFEEIIVEAGVARSAVYRRWPTKSHFFADLLRDLAGANHPATARYERESIASALGVALQNTASLATDEGRRWLLVEILRHAALANFQSLVNSRSWSTHVTLMATLSSLPENADLQEDLRRALFESDEAFYGEMAATYGALMFLTGHQVRSDLPGVTTMTIAQLGAAVVEGLTLNAISNTSLAEQRFTIDPFGVGEAEWSLAGLGFTQQLMSLVEADPGQAGHWDEATIAEHAAILTQFA